MSLTVYAEGMGLFHKGSGGKGIAPADVCLSPPPPPAGPVPVPYVNMLSASDLAKGSKKVTIDGEPTALAGDSEVSTSTGDEAGTQGGSVVNGKTNGKGYFTAWSFSVFVEGKGVACHGDPMGQNSASAPPTCVDAAAITAFQAFDWVDPEADCGPFPGNVGTSPAQNEEVRGGPCWECDTSDSGWRKRKAKGQKWPGYVAGERFTPDHQPPQKAAWFLGGCNDPEEFKKWAKSTASTQHAHCKSCSSSQGGAMSNQSMEDIQAWD